MAGPSGVSVIQTKKRRIPITSPITTSQSLPEIESKNLPSFFDSPNNQAALPANKWLRVSKQPWPLGRRFAVPLLSGPAAVRHLNSKLRSDPIGSDPFRFHRSSRLGLVLSDPTPELRTAGLFWTVKRGGGSRAHSLSGHEQEHPNFRPNTCT